MEDSINLHEFPFSSQVKGIAMRENLKNQLKLENKRLISCQIEDLRPRQDGEPYFDTRLYLYIVDLKNFEIIAVILNKEFEGKYNPANFNKVYNSIGCRKYYCIGLQF